jgi:hypothetical protein
MSESSKSFADMIDSVLKDDNGLPDIFDSVMNDLEKLHGITFKPNGAINECHADDEGSDILLERCQTCDRCGDFFPNELLVVIIDGGNSLSYCQTCLPIVEAEMVGDRMCEDILDGGG